MASTGSINGIELRIAKLEIVSEIRTELYLNFFYILNAITLSMFLFSELSNLVILTVRLTPTTTVE